MRRRLVSSIIGALLGVVAAPWINSTLGLGPIAALVAGAVTGVLLGYLASMLFDVFTGDIGSTSDASSRD